MITAEEPFTTTETKKKYNKLFYNILEIYFKCKKLVGDRTEWLDALVWGLLENVKGVKMNFRCIEHAKYQSVAAAAVAAEMSPQTRYIIRLWGGLCVL